MAKYDFRILLETVEGKKLSYYSSSFVDTSVDTALSSSQVFNRITGSVSCSYQNNEIFTGTVGSGTFKENTLLSASLTGSAESGSIEFISLTTDYDRLSRYKFIGSEKVCNVLGLPSSTWIYVDQFRLPSDDEPNYFEGNMKSNELYVEDTLTFANTSTLNSDLPILINTGSDRYIRFTDTRGTPTNALLMGYDVDDDVYEITAPSSNFRSRITNFNTGSFDRIKAEVAILGASTDPTSIFFSSGDIDMPPGGFISMHDGQTPPASGNVTSINFRRLSGTDDNGILVFRAGSSDKSMIISGSRVGINTQDSNGADITHTLTVAGDIYADGDVISNRFVTSESISVVHTSSGSTVFGNSSDDLHRFTGSLFVSSSGTNLTLEGDISASNITTENLYVNTEPYFKGSEVNIDGDDPKYLFFRTSGGTTQGYLARTEGSLRINNSSAAAHLVEHLVISGGYSTDTARVGIGIYPLPQAMLAVAGNIHTNSHITASGDISASGAISIGGDITQVGTGTGAFISASDGTIEISGSGEALLQVAGNISSSGAIHSLSHITASGNLTVLQSGSFTGGITVAGDLDVDGVANLDIIDVDGTANFADDITIAEDKKIIFDSVDTYITANTENPEDLEIHADHDVLIDPDSDLVVRSDTIVTGSVNSSLGFHVRCDTLSTAAARITLQNDKAGADANNRISLPGITLASGSQTIDITYRAQDILLGSTYDGDHSNLGALRFSSSFGGNVVFDYSKDQTNYVPYVGIGHKYPTKPLYVQGGIQANTGSLHNYESIFGNHSGDGLGVAPASGSRVTIAAGNLGSASLYFASSNQRWEIAHNKNHSSFESGGGLVFRNMGSSVFVLQMGGNVGIGNNNPEEKLTVEGNISSSGGFLVSGSQQGGSFGTVMVNADTTGSMNVNGDQGAGGTDSSGVGAFSVNYGSGTQLSGSLTQIGMGYGEIVKFGASTGLTKGYVYYLDRFGNWQPVNATDTNSGADELLAMSLGTNSDIDGMLLRGICTTNCSGTSAQGRAIYMNTSDGLITFTAPSGNNNIVRVVGYSLGIAGSVDTLYFNPGTTWVEVTT